MSNETHNTSTEIAIIREENISTIVKAGPESFRANHASSIACINAGEQLLKEIEAAGGLNDELDQRAASFIVKTRRTIKAMNERRSPVTKLFDQVRSEFTALENSIDVGKSTTIPGKLQALRDAYAKKKLEEAEARRREEEARRAIEQAKINYNADVFDAYKRSFNILVTDMINQLTELNASTTLENYDAVVDTMTGFPSTLPSGWTPQCSVLQPYNLTPADCKALREEACSTLMPQFEQQFAMQVGDYRQELLDKLPSKRTELQRIAKANEAEAQRIKDEMAKLEAQEAARREEQRKAQEAEEQKKAELDKANAEMSGLFAEARAQTDYAPKAKVKKKISITTPDAILPLISAWWQREGCLLSVDELCKMFKKQITFCEKLADSEEFYIKAQGLDYIDDVKAR